jgi:hypothetical protein
MSPPCRVRMATALQAAQLPSASGLSQLNKSLASRDAIRKYSPIGTKNCIRASGREMHSKSAPLRRAGVVNLLRPVDQSQRCLRSG